MTDSSIYTVNIDPAVSSDKYYYALTMFPYPSGSGLHVGHASVFTINDIVARFKRMNGYTVLNPFGFDSFGLPTENYAMKQGRPAYDITKENGEMFLKQVKALNMSFDMSRVLYSSDPEYYKWTQWIFAKLFEKNLVYRAKLRVNRCPECQTVLANDQVVDGKCERCGTEIIQKKMPQWFIKITAYADRLIQDLDLVDRPEETKTAQRNWIGRSEGAEIQFEVQGGGAALTVFTTRPDTLFGVTAVVLAPENTSLDAYIPENEKVIVQHYRQETAKKTAVERQQNEKEKSGVYSGIYVVHPLTGEHVPVWFADYVLPDYATGAVMFVPAHDERDYEFAQKNDLRIKVVIENPNEENEEDDAYTCYTGTGKLINSGDFDGLDNAEAKKKITDRLIELGKGSRKVNYKLRDRSVSRQRYRGSPIPMYYDVPENPLVPFFKYTEGHRGFKEGLPVTTRATVQVIVKDKNSDMYCFLKWTHDNDVSGFFGGIEEGETPIEAGLRELREEGGFEEVSHAEEVIHYQLQFYHPTKNRNQYSLNTTVYFEVDRESQKPVGAEETAQHTTVWMTAEEFLAVSKNDTTIFVLKKMLGQEYMTEGRTMKEMYNEYNPAPSDNLVPKLIPEDELPVLLPLDIENYKPKGKSPLEEHPTFPHYTAKDGKTYLRECDTLDTFMCSAFYFLRFVDAHNPDALVRKERADKLLPVDFYSGGKEHTVGHLLYSRFIHKFLYDEGYVPSPEPFMKLVHQGMVLAHDGRKMGKRFNNSIDPLDVISKYNSDSLRTYLMFMGPVEADKNWNDNALQGVHRFLDRVRRLSDMLTTDASDEVDSLLHKTIKGVTEDLQKYKFNTAVSKLMILVNKVYEVQKITKEQLKSIVQLLAPFATEVAEEIWLSLGGETSVHLSVWPRWEESKILDAVLTLPVQINGKKKFDVEVPAGLSEEEAMQEVKNAPAYERNIGDAPIKKIIYVQDKIINIIL